MRYYVLYSISGKNIHIHPCHLHTGGLRGHTGVLHVCVTVSGLERKNKCTDFVMTERLEFFGGVPL